MIEFEFKFEFTALFKISLKQTYPNQERIQKILVGDAVLILFEC